MRVPYRKPGKYSQMKQDHMLTETKAKELQEKLDRLKNYSRPKAAEEVRRLAELGDFSENVEYQLAKGKLRGINSSILTIEHQLNNAEIISNPNTVDTVQVGHTVTITNGEKEKKYLILGSSETDPTKGIISHVSPLGTALLGKKIGDTVQIKSSEKEIGYTVIGIE
jgi:transcription elongation factor GreA